MSYVKADLIRTYDPLLVGGRVYPGWLKDKTRFYFTEYGEGADRGVVYLVDPARKTKLPFFSNAAIAKALAKASKIQIDAAKLPVWKLDTAETHLVFKVAEHSYSCSLETQDCDATGEPAFGNMGTPPDWVVRSPDGQWDAFVWNNNVYVRHSTTTDSQSHGTPANHETGPGIRPGTYCDFPVPPGVPTNPTPQLLPGDSVALSTDGELLWSYASIWRGGAEPGRIEANQSQLSHGTIVWSPDSKKLLARRDDLRGVLQYPLYSSTSNQPVDHSYFYAAPGAEHIPRFEWYVLTVDSKSSVRIDVPAVSVIGAPGDAFWGSNNQSLFVFSSDRGPKHVTLFRVDPATGAAKPLIQETSSTAVDIGAFEPEISAPQSDDILWLSERDGWRHIYNYSKEGVLRKQVESGSYAVARIAFSDPVKKQLYFTAWGKAPGIPYYAHLYRVNFDGSGMLPLTPEPGNHTVTFSADGAYFLDTYSSIEKPPVSVLRTSNGALLLELSRGHVEGLRKTGWTAAEPFTVKARDGDTDLYGVLYKPSNFDPKRRYPVIANIYPGPQEGSVGQWVFKGPDSFVGGQVETRVQDRGVARVTHGEGMNHSLAELGFIVVQLDAMGTSRRSRQFRDFFYGHVGDNGLPDQIAALKQLAEKYSWMDLNRVGVFGHSGGGYSAGAAMLHYPDFFKVGVSEAGNHDFRVYGWYWGERYQGLYQKKGVSDNYEAEADYKYAANLKGKLLLIHGDMDCNNPPAETLRVVDALVKAGKNFDMLLIPDSGHQLPDYVMKRVWDYFVTNLLGAKAPEDYKLLPFDR